MRQVGQVVAGLEHGRVSSVAAWDGWLPLWRASAETSIVFDCSQEAVSFYLALCRLDGTSG